MASAEHGAGMSVQSIKASLAKPAKIASGWWRRGFEWLSGIWAGPRDVWQTIVVARASVILVVAGWLLLASDQGRDILIFAGERVGFGSFGEASWLLSSFVLFASLWAVSAWYWALTMLRFELPRWREGRCDARRRHRLRWLVRWVPQILGVAAFAAALVFLNPNVRGISPEARDGLVALRVATVVALVLFVAFDLVHPAFFKRPRRLRAWLKERLISRRWWPWIAGIAAAIIVGVRWREPRRKDLEDFYRRQWSVSGAMLLISIVFGLILLVWSWIDPISVGNVFRADVLFFIWAASGIGIVSLLVYMAEAYRLPILLFLAACAILFSFWNDNHRIRFIASEQDGPAARPTVAEAARTWAMATFADAKGNATEPLIVVATAGGGSRAAYWTVTVLGALQDCYPAFKDHLFGISGVSGGSLGAVVFRAILTDHGETRAAGCSQDKVKESKDGVAPKAQAVIGKDFLTANVAALLFPDLMARFSPVPLESADRARAIEAAWEDAYRRAVAPENENRAAAVSFSGLDGSFINAWAGPLHGQATKIAEKAWPGPGLFLNGTWVETGRRVVVSSFKLNEPVTPDSPPPAFAVADDFFDLVKHQDIRLSTAAGLSARFPLVLPAATIDGVGHLVDGGYFENYGAETASEVLTAALKTIDKPVCKRKAAGERGSERDADALTRNAENPPCVIPVVILISSDPTLPEDFFGTPSNVPPVDWVYETRSPLRTFLKTREARGLLAAANLEKQIDALGGHFVHFRMCGGGSDTEDGPEQRDPPLGWALSAHAQTAIKKLLTFGQSTCDLQNKRQWATMHTLLEPAKEDADPDANPAKQRFLD